MASARNMVIAGDLTGCRVFRMSASLAYISGTMKKAEDVFLTAETVSRCELMTEDLIRSGNSLLLTGALDPGLLRNLRLHATQAAQKKGIYTLAVKLEDGRRCLMEIDEKIYAAILRRTGTAP
ncbi:MAG: hypothetical protein K6E36_07700 [Oscillospiraceae bacterium]|nr:hypothetical protein [Oscillospiraceae bacterium]MCR5306362.1 hypothetical protein [Oscillospiraceae bacterium]